MIIKNGRFAVDTIALKKVLVDHRLDKMRDLENMSGISRPVLTSILSGRAIPSTRTICALAETLKLSSSEIGQVFFSTFAEERKE